MVQSIWLMMIINFSLVRCSIIKGFGDTALYKWEVCIINAMIVFMIISLIDIIDFIGSCAMTYSELERVSTLAKVVGLGFMLGREIYA